MKIAVITGGMGALASVLARELAASGLDVRSPGRAELDVTDSNAVESYFSALEGPVALLVNNAGVTRDRLLARLTPDDWEAVLDANLRGAWQCARAVLPGMRTASQGHIVNIASFSAFSGPPGQAAYAAAKAGMLAFTQSLAAEEGPHNIRVNAILPGVLETAMTASLSPEVREAMRSRHVLGRFNTCEDVSRFIRFLHLEMGDVSGQIFQLDSRLRRPGW